MKNAVKLGLALICFVLIAACQKNGVMETAPQVTEGRVKIFSFNSDSRFSITIDDEKLIDSLISSDLLTRIVTKKEGLQHFVVRDIVRNTIMVDTMLVLEKPSFELSVIQFDTTPGRRPLVVGGTSAIAEDSARMAFYLEDTSIAIPVDVFLYRSDISLNTLDTTPLYIFREVKRFSATEFISVPMTESIGFSVVIRNSVTGELVQTIANNYVVPEDAFSGIALGLCISPGGTEPANVHTLLGLGPAWEGSEFWAGLCKIYF